MLTLAGLITKGGISGEATPAIRTEIWNKLISNLAGGTVAVLTGSAPKDAYVEPAVEHAALRMMQEATGIAQALGPDPTTNHAQRIGNQRSMDHKPSIPQDLELGRPMEIDACSTPRWHWRTWPALRCRRWNCWWRCANCGPGPRDYTTDTRRGTQTMETRIFGRSGLRLSILGFGCGAVGGLMVRGSPR